MGQLEQTLTAASTAVPARERARGTVLQAHPCEKRIHRLLLIPPRTRPATREIISPISHDKTKEDKGKSRKIDRSNRRSLPRERLQRKINRSLNRSDRDGQKAMTNTSSLTIKV